MKIRNITETNFLNRRRGRGKRVSVVKVIGQLLRWRLDGKIGTGYPISYKRTFRPLGDPLKFD